MILSLFSFVPMMGMFKPTKRFIPFTYQQLSPWYQKQRPARLQDVSNKNQAEQTKAKAQKFKAKKLQQQKEQSKTNNNG
jgi:hypothetical protein